MSYPFHHSANYRLFKFAKENRTVQTTAEGLLWNHLRNRQQLGKKFRRQHPLGAYIVDFYCHECRVVVEADGSIHQRDDNPSYDEERTLFLEDLGIKVLRFKNEEIIHDINKVLQVIRLHLKDTPLTS